MQIDVAIKLVETELQEAIMKHREMMSPHEGYAIIKEELDELWEAIRKARNFKERNEPMKNEAIQVAAMAIRFLVDLIDA